LDIIEDKYGYEWIKWDILLGYLFWDTISNHILIITRYPTISYHILSYPFISFHILKYPRGRTPRWGQLDAARDKLLDDDDERVGLVKDVKEVEKRLRHKLLPRNAWRLVPFFELFMSAPKDELHQWLVVCPFMCMYSDILP
jgi:hypothetical protein